MGICVCPVKAAKASEKSAGHKISAVTGETASGWGRGTVPHGG